MRIWRESLCIGVTFEEGDCVGGILVDEAGNALGEFCTDSCVVSVVLQRDMLAYAPEVLAALPKHCYAVISDFDGTVERIDHPEDEYWTLRGLENHPFRTVFED